MVFFFTKKSPPCRSAQCPHNEKKGHPKLNIFQMYVKMPKLCQHENCRNRAKTDFCTKHKTKSQNKSQEKNIPIEISEVCIIKTCHRNSIRLCKNYCADCYFREFPNDPLTFQMKYKTKEQAVKEFINSRFDGFNRDCVMKIGDVTLFVNYNKNIVANKMEGKYISIIFNVDKYVDGNTKRTVNPMLYTRLPVLEREINHQIEKMLDVNIEKSETVKLFVS